MSGCTKIGYMTHWQKTGPTDICDKIKQYKTKEKRSLQNTSGVRLAAARSSIETGTVLTLFKRIDEATVLATRGAQSVTTGANTPLPGNQEFSASIWPPRP